MNTNCNSSLGIFTCAIKYTFNSLFIFKKSIFEPMNDASDMACYKNRKTL